MAWIGWMAWNGMDGIFCGLSIYFLLSISATKKENVFRYSNSWWMAGSLVGSLE